MLSGAALKGAVSASASVLVKTASLTASLATAIYRNSGTGMLGSLTGGPLGYLASGYAPSAMEYAANAAGSLIGYTPGGAVLGSAAGALLGYTATKTMPAIAAYAVEKSRQLPPALQDAGLQKGDLSPELAKKIAALPTADQEVLAQSLAALKKENMLNAQTDSSFRSSAYMAALATIFVRLHNAGFSLKNLYEPAKSPLFSYSAKRLNNLAVSLGEFQTTKQTARVLHAVIHSENPSALARIFLAFQKAKLLLLPLPEYIYIFDPNYAKASDLETLSIAIEALVGQMDRENLEFYVKAILSSKTPAMMAHTLAVLITRGVLPKKNVKSDRFSHLRFNALTQNLAETSQILNILASGNILNERACAAVMEASDPIAMAKALAEASIAAAAQQEAARIDLIALQSCARYILEKNKINTPENVAAASRSKDPIRMARALVKLHNAQILNDDHRAELVRLDPIYPHPEALNQTVEELAVRSP